MTRFIGIIPAAGIGSRLAPFQYPKELLPVLFIADHENSRARPMLVAEYSLRAMRHAGIRSCLITISDRKTEILRYFRNGVDIGIHIAYLHQAEPHGLAHAVDAGFEWFGGDYVCLAMPDTIFYPFEAIARVCEEVLTRQSDLVLGVFPTSKPEQLGPVRIDSDNCVTEVLDKPTQTDLYNAWGIATWSPRFTSFLHDCVKAEPGDVEQPIGNIFNRAVLCGLRVHAVLFQNGTYIDIGTPENLGSLILHHDNQSHWTLEKN